MSIDVETLNELWEATVEEIEEDQSLSVSPSIFEESCENLLPVNILRALKKLLNVDDLTTIWEDRFPDQAVKYYAAHPRSTASAGGAVDEEVEVVVVAEEEVETDEMVVHELGCELCERVGGLALTRHHRFPREIHKRLLKRKVRTRDECMSTIQLCRMCHSTVHKFFSNDELADHFYTIDLLVEDERVARYAKWASKQKVGGRVL